MLNSAFWTAVIVALLVACVTPAHADATLLLQEPYGHLGGLSPTGHAAIYFSRICSDSPTVLRRCAPGEVGVVISRYSRIRKYDWIAIPLLPYLYALDQPDEVPASIDRDTAVGLRDYYRRRHLLDLAPDEHEDKRPGGTWVELVGAAYNRKIYAFQLTTTEAQDDKLIELLNSRPNKTRFNFFFNNCADFARRIMNFYFPGAVHRSYIADMGLMTPKQLAKSLVKYHKKHPEVQLSVYVIPQVPGSMSRSTAIHGVAESLLKTKKYFLPLVYFQPIFTTSLATAYFTKGRFNPGHDATVLQSAADISILTGVPADAVAARHIPASMPTFMEMPKSIVQLAPQDSTLNQ
jgi:hypothetical protein